MWRLLHDPNATFAGAVALFTLALVGVGVIQARQLRRTVDATREAAAALPNIERAYVFVRVTMPDAPILTEAGSVDSFLAVEIDNHGRTPAILQQINALAHPTDRRPDALVSSDIRDLPPGLVVAPSTSYRQIVSFRVSTAQWHAVKSLDLLLVCYRRIRYQDVLNNHRETGFCWEYQERSDFKGFQISPGTPLNRRT
jgi:hypothetical protein